MNPRVSRSSALASKATGYPIAKVASKIAIGYSLDEIVNAVTGKTYACFEPALDYLVVKFPKWPFDKFVYAKPYSRYPDDGDRRGHGIGTSFEQAMMKAVRSIELKVGYPGYAQDERDDHRRTLRCHPEQNDERIFAVYEALKRGESFESLHEVTKIDLWFFGKLKNLIEMEKWLADGELTAQQI